MVVKLGIIGLSDGNGHPYSWSAIINGYDQEAMKSCGFPVIPKYLAKQNFPKDSISDAEVTHVLTQDINVSKHIAKASKIPFVVKNFTDMIGKVDAVLLARDDYENHEFYALPFLQKGIPIYIDKPLACNVDQAKRMLSHQKFPGQIFTCSALKYAKEFRLSNEQIKDLGKVYYIHSVIPKNWNKYSIHLIDPIIQFPIEKGSIKWSRVNKFKMYRNLTLMYSNDLLLSINTVGELKTPIKISLCGDRNYIELTFEDTFLAFKSALEEFINIVKTKSYNDSTKRILEAVRLIELGRAKDE